ncbi:MAG: hypothetical protein WCJ41_17630 [Aestuariivirga sp.]|uniref:hypothetical protein n=1 Tax=Aestuariivirga sp. TaxID=2650926 RepID=UPI003017CDD5
MILSHSHKFIVFKTRKTGGTSFEIALSKYMASEDVVTPVAPDDEKIRSALGYTGPRNYVPDVAGKAGEGVQAVKFYNHIGAAEVRSMIPADRFGAYLKVAIVRNPFDYAVSWYFWERSRVAETSRDDFQKWLRFQYVKRPEIEAEYRLNQRPNPGMFSSNRFITHVDGRCAVDRMLRYEHMQEDVAEFAHQVGLPVSLGSEFRAIRAKGNYRPAAATARVMFENFSDGQEMIKTAFSDEIATHNYQLT